MAVRRIEYFATFILVALLCAPLAAQGPVRGKIEPERDKVLEINSKHNLDVARWSISKRKAYKGGIDRLQEILDTHPDFSRMDEVLYWMGEAHIKLNELEKAEPFLSKLVKDYPESEFVKKAKEHLDKIKPGSGKT